MFKDFVEDLSRFHATTKVRGHSSHRLLKPLGHPLMGGDLLFVRPHADLDAVGVQIVKETSSLVFLDV